MTYKEIYDIAMPEKKRKEERWNLWVTIAVRPLSILLTVPFTNTNVKPTTITKWSVLANLIGFFLVAFAQNLTISIIGWLFFFIWAILDGVDGNLARSTNQCSPMGDLWDTMGGYAAMVLIYFSAGIAAYFDDGVFMLFDKYWLLILGGATAVMSIFPRLVMHKKKSSNMEDKSVKAISDKQNFSLSKIAAMNIVSPSGFMQVLFLIAILFHVLNIFTIFYFIVNLGIMTMSLRSLLKE
ncbi:MAG: CDP-alcohol phosphatidyltransferase family protein [Prevotella sp.]|nr:CDP-alcohol phosphatidyltransferase family protein [Prevotella sp.]